MSTDSPVQTVRCGTEGAQLRLCALTAAPTSIGHRPPCWLSRAPDSALQVAPPPRAVHRGVGACSSTAPQGPRHRAALPPVCRRTRRSRRSAAPAPAQAAAPAAGAPRPPPPAAAPARRRPAGRWTGSLRAAGAAAPPLHPAQASRGSASQRRCTRCWKWALRPRVPVRVCGAQCASALEVPARALSAPGCRRDRAMWHLAQVRSQAKVSAAASGAQADPPGTSASASITSSEAWNKLPT